MKPIPTVIHNAAQWLTDHALPCIIWAGVMVMRLINQLPLTGTEKKLYNDEDDNDDDTTDDVTDQTPLNPNPSGDLPPPPSPTSPKGQDTASILAGLATDDVDNEPRVRVRIADNITGDA